jgi:uncharacterized protein with HEPN domain
MEKRDRLYLQHIADAVEKILNFTEDMEFEEFEKDELLQGAVIHQFLIIGEAANNVSYEFRDVHPDWPWRGMISMRNKLIHDYFHVSLEDVWKTLSVNLHEIKKLLNGQL